jgi:hypothetical protein
MIDFYHKGFYQEESIFMLSFSHIIYKSFHFDNGREARVFVLIGTFYVSKALEVLYLEIRIRVVELFEYIVRVFREIY